MGTVRATTDSEPVTLAIEGDLDHAACGELIDRARALGAAGLVLDLGGLGRLDSVAIAAICEAYRIAAERGGAMRLEGVTPEVRRLLEVFKVPQALRAGAPALFDPYAETSESILESIGGGAMRLAQDFRGLVMLAGETVYWVIAAPFLGETPRILPVVRHIGKFGSDAIPIVALIACLTGIALAINASYQLAPLGAVVFVANMTGVAIARALGPLITAIVVAGRSGAEIAAEIGTMVVSEEVDALRTMGLNPVRQIVVPKIIALTIALPLLTALADIFGILGGFLVGVGIFGINRDVYIDRTLYAVTNADFLSGLAKAAVFALLIGLVGCHRGFNVARGAEGVGRATTSAVVMSIFLIIVADTVMTMIFFAAKHR